MLGEYREFRKQINEPEVNSGLVRKCEASRWRGAATIFEGATIKSMGMATGLSKKKLLQQALRTMTDAGTPATSEYVLPQLLAYAREHGGSTKAVVSGTKPEPSGRSVADASTAIVSTGSSASASSAAAAKGKQPPKK